MKENVTFIARSKEKEISSTSAGSKNPTNYRQVICGSCLGQQILSNQIQTASSFENTIIIVADRELEFSSIELLFD